MGELQTTFLAFIFGGGVAGSGLVAYLKWFSESAKKAREDRATFDERELKRYKEHYENFQRQIDALNIAIIPSPSPEWKKDGRRRYIYVSASYELSVLLPLGMSAADVLQKTDAEIFKDYPSFVSVLNGIDEEAQRGTEHIAVRHGVFFPKNPRQMMVIKEIAQNVKRETLYIGRAYPDSLTGAPAVCYRAAAPGDEADVTRKQT